MGVKYNQKQLDKKSVFSKSRSNGKISNILSSGRGKIYQ